MTDQKQSTPPAKATPANDQSPMPTVAIMNTDENGKQTVTHMSVAEFELRAELDVTRQQASDALRGLAQQKAKWTSREAFLITQLDQRTAMVAELQETVKKLMTGNPNPPAPPKNENDLVGNAVASAMAELEKLKGKPANAELNGVIPNVK